VELMTIDTLKFMENESPLCRKLNAELADFKRQLEGIAHHARKGFLEGFYISCKKRDQWKYAISAPHFLEDVAELLDSYGMAPHACKLRAMQVEIKPADENINIISLLRSIGGPDKIITQEKYYSHSFEPFSQYIKREKEPWNKSRNSNKELFSDIIKLKEEPWSDSRNPDKKIYSEIKKENPENPDLK